MLDPSIINVITTKIWIKIDDNLGIIDNRLLPEYFYYEIFSKYHLTHAMNDIIDDIVKLVHYTIFIDR